MSLFNLSEKLQARKENKEKVQQARTLYFGLHPEYKNYKSGSKLHGKLDLDNYTFTCLSSAKIKEGQIYMDLSKSVRFNIVSVKRGKTTFNHGPVALSLDICKIQKLK